ncbi:SDR family NAD(P)-dependent oxidoreductase [Leptothrix discophora]|uniref:SDR family NAD(P)-dependent oxidoreductase n=1 Tax=Leptothrix discophora TaxID=89 RepID=A0ABT9FYM1_LEPDI|nr:SDR family NAD(P)-dependent oxidoreductase [Leptothrix discophora]MDP4299338.1 SDR family NAD(P)-dependent oxidoreductase [Leptothrix discophora]
MKLALVTGGSRGLGLALCQQLEQAGWQLREFSRSAPHAHSVRVDFADPDAVVDAVEATLAAIDPLACTELLVIGNAGTLSPIGPTWRQPARTLRQNLDANLTSAILFLATVVRHFRAAPCRKTILTVSSGAATKGYAGWSLYSASKAGLEGYIRALAAEEAREPQPFIAVSVNPGVIDTAMQALIRSTDAADFPEVERFRQRHRDGQLATPAAVAASILRLAARDDLPAGGVVDAAPGR